MNALLSRSELAQLSASVHLRVIGVTTAEPFYDLAGVLTTHIAAGHVAGMHWFTPERAVESTDPAILHPCPRSIISVALPYWSGPATPPCDGVPRGRIARYAWGRDYHGVLRERMRAFVAALEQELGRTLISRTLVDTARIVDRAVAARSGVGWYGKNSMILVPNHGSWVMLGEIILDIDLPPDLPLARDCGRCTICIERCPTGAIVGPYSIHAPACISYLTIEERGPIPVELRSRMQNWVFGCDVCQDVCPYTNAALPVADPAMLPRGVDNMFPSLPLLVWLTNDQFQTIYGGTAVKRAKRVGLARNAVIALGNSGQPAAQPVLERALREHESPIVRGHAAWALRHLAGADARRPLHNTLVHETDSYVRSEIEAALAA